MPKMPTSHPAHPDDLSIINGNWPQTALNVTFIYSKEIHPSDRLNFAATG